MRWQKSAVRATNLTRGVVVGDRVRLAETGLTRIVGLLGERGLPSGDGLLIVPSQGVHTWGMMFSIDVVILDNDWKVIAVRPNMGSFRMTRIFFDGAAVLELPAGTIASTSTAVGDAFEFKRLDNGR